MAVTNGQSGNDLVQRSQTMINQALDRGTGLLADRVEHYTTIAREVGDILRERGEPAAADLAGGLAERSQGLARYLRNSDGTQLIADLQNAVRGRGWLLTGVGVVSGLALARAVRTSADATPSKNSQYTERYSRTGGYSGSQYAEQYTR